MGECSQDVDCEKVGEVCYDGVSWSDRNESFCDCARYFQGEDCSELSEQTIILIVGFSISLVTCIVLLLTFVIPALIRFEKIKKNSNLGHGFLAVACFTVSQICMNSVRISALLSPEKYGSQVRENSKQPNHDGAYRFLAAMALFFYYHANLTLSLVWVDAAARTLKLSTESSDFMIRFRKVARITQVVMSILFFFVLIFAYLLTTSFVFFFGLSLALLNARAVHDFRKLRAEYTSFQNSESDAMNAVKRIELFSKLQSCLHAAITLLTIPVFHFIAKNMDNKIHYSREIQPTGSHYFSNLFLLAYLLVVGSVVAVAVYLRRLVFPREHSSSSKFTTVGSI